MARLRKKPKVKNVGRMAAQRDDFRRRSSRIQRSYYVPLNHAGKREREVRRLRSRVRWLLRWLRYIEAHCADTASRETKPFLAPLFQAALRGERVPVTRNGSPRSATPSRSCATTPRA